MSGRERNIRYRVSCPRSSRGVVVLERDSASVFGLIFSHLKCPFVVVEREGYRCLQLFSILRYRSSYFQQHLLRGWHDGMEESLTLMHLYHRTPPVELIAMRRT